MTTAGARQALWEDPRRNAAMVEELRPAQPLHAATLVGVIEHPLNPVRALRALRAILPEDALAVRVNAAALRFRALRFRPDDILACQRTDHR